MKNRILYLFPIGTWFILLIALIFILFVISLPLGLNFACGITPVSFIGIKLLMLSSFFHVVIRTKSKEKGSGNFLLFCHPKIMNLRKQNAKTVHSTKSPVLTHLATNDFVAIIVYLNDMGLGAPSSQGGCFLAWKNPVLIHTDSGSMALWGILIILIQSNLMSFMVFLYRP